MMGRGGADEKERIKDWNINRFASDYKHWVHVSSSPSLHPWFVPCGNRKS